jgi:hypothetical protein
VPDALEYATRRVERILALLEESDVGGYLELVGVPALPEAESSGDGALGYVRLQLLFRAPDGAPLLPPTDKSAREPYVLLEETLSVADAGEVISYNYDVVFPEWDTHCGFHLHNEPGEGNVPHRQGYGVPNEWEKFRRVDLAGDDVLWDLVSTGFQIEHDKAR